MYASGVSRSGGKWRARDIVAFDIGDSSLLKIMVLLLRGLYGAVYRTSREPFCHFLRYPRRRRETCRASVVWSAECSGVCGYTSDGNEGDGGWLIPGSSRRQKSPEVLVNNYFDKKPPTWKRTCVCVRARLCRAAHEESCIQNARATES